MTIRALPPSARRPIAAIWFAAFALLFTILSFRHLSVLLHAIFLYIALPSLAAGIAGYIWGGAILDSSHVKTYRQTVLRGLAVSIGAEAIFSVLYACGLAILEAQLSLEGQLSLGAVGRLFLFTVMFATLMVKPLALAAATGMIAAVTLFRFGRHVFGESDDRISESSGG